MDITCITLNQYPSSLHEAPLGGRVPLDTIASTKALESMAIFVGGGILLW